MFTGIVEEVGTVVASSGSSLKVECAVVLGDLKLGDVTFVDPKTGATLEYFQPGDGVSAQPTITSDGRLFVMSNRGILYAFDLD